MQNKMLYVPMGIPGCGKTSYYYEKLEQQGFRLVSPDNIRKELTGNAIDQSANAEVFFRANDILRSIMKEGTNVYFDATNLTEDARNGVIRYAHQFGYTKTLVVFRTLNSVCCERNSARERVVPQHAMVRMAQQFGSALSKIAYEDWDAIKFVNE